MNKIASTDLLRHEINQTLRMRHFLFIVLLQNISAQSRNYISDRIVSSGSPTVLADCVAGVAASSDNGLPPVAFHEIMPKQTH